MRVFLRYFVPLAPACAPAFPQIVAKGEDAEVDFGFEGQFWGDWAQTSTTGPLNYQQNSYLRRVRLIDRGLMIVPFARTGVFAGERDSNARDSLRSAAYLHNDFFNRETGYTFIGTALGKKKILAVDGGFDAQGSYHSGSGNVAADLPVHHGDEIGGQLPYIHYHGGSKFLTIPDQNDYPAEAADYVRRIKTQPFVKAETQQFVAAVNDTENVDRLGAGLDFYIHRHNLKRTAQYLRILPQNSPTRPSNEFTVQLQFFHF